MKKFILSIFAVMALLLQNLQADGGPNNYVVCANAVEFSCGQVVKGSNIFPNVITNTHLRNAGCYSGSSPFDGKELYLKIDVGTVPVKLMLTMSGLSDDLDLFVFKGCTEYAYPNSVSLGACQGKSLNYNASDEQVIIEGATGSYFVLIDAYKASICSNFYLTAKCINTTPPPLPVVDLCAKAKTLTCGETTWGQNTETDYINTAYIGSRGCYNGTQTFTGTEAYYMIDAGTTPRDLTISMTGVSADLDLFVFKPCVSNTSTTSVSPSSPSLGACAGQSINPNNENETITIKNASGKYFILIDAEKPGYKSMFELSAKCADIPPPKTNNICALATKLSCGGTAWGYNDQPNTVSAAMISATGCYTGAADFDGNEAYFIVDAGATATDLTITMDGMNKDLDLFLFESCTSIDPRVSVTTSSGFALGACKGQSYNPGISSETITIKGAKGQYFLLVDGHASSGRGTYDIKVSCSVPAVPLCSKTFTTLNCESHAINNNTATDPLATDVIDQHTKCVSGNYSYDAHEVIYNLTPTASSTTPITIDLNTMSSNTDLDLFVYSECSNSTFDRLVSCSIGRSGNESIKSTFTKGWPYYVVVDGSPNTYIGTEGKFQVHVSCGEPCDNKTIGNIQCGQTIQGSTSGSSNNASLYYLDPTDNKGNNWGPENVYKLVVDATYDMEITLTPKTSKDFNLYLLKDKCSANNTFAISKTIGQGIGEKIKLKISPGTYYIVIEGYLGDFGDYTLKVDGCDCVSQALTCGATIQSSTEGASTFYGNLSCTGNIVGDANDKEKVYQFTAPKSGTYLFNLSGMSRNLNLILLQPRCDLAQCIETNSYSANFGNVDEQYIYNMTAGQIIYVLVKEFNQGASNFNLSVECDPCTDVSNKHSLPAYSPTSNSNIFKFKFLEGTQSYLNSPQEIKWSINGKQVANTSSDGLTGNFEVPINQNISVCLTWKGKNENGKYLCYQYCSKVFISNTSTSCNFLTQSTSSLGIAKFINTSDKEIANWTLYKNNKYVETIYNKSNSKEVIFNTAIGGGEYITIGVVYKNPGNPNYSICYQSFCIASTENCGYSLIKPVFVGNPTEVSKGYYHYYMNVTYPIGATNISWLVYQENDPNWKQTSNLANPTFNLPGLTDNPIYIVKLSYKVGGSCDQTCSIRIKPNNPYQCTSDISTQCNNGKVTISVPQIANDSVASVTPGNPAISPIYWTNSNKDIIGTNQSKIELQGISASDVFTYFEKCDANGCYLQVCKVTVEQCGVSELTCGTSQSFNNKNGVDVYNQNNYKECWALNQYSMTAPELVFKIRKQSKQDRMYITMTHGTNESQNLTLYLFDRNFKCLSEGKGQNFTTTKKIGTLPNILGEVLISLENALDSGIYYLVVDGIDPSRVTDFTLNLDCNAPAFAQATPLNCESVIVDSTQGVNQISIYDGNNSTSSAKMIGYTGPEKIYTIQGQLGKQIELGLTFSSGDPLKDLDIIVLDSAYSINKVIATTRLSTTDNLSFTPKYTGRYYVVIDGFNSARLPFNLTAIGCKTDAELPAPATTPETYWVKAATDNIVEGLNITPNPFKFSTLLNITLKKPQTFNIRVLSVVGQELYRSTHNGQRGVNQIEINRDQISTTSGIYLIEIQSENQRWTEKLFLIE